MVGNKIADKITSLGKIKSVKKEKEEEERQEIYIPPKKGSKLLMTWDCFRHCIKMEYQNVTNLLGTTLRKYLDLLLKNGKSSWSVR